MDVLLMISFFFLLSAATGQFQTDSQTNLRFHADQHNYTRNILKLEIGKYVSNLTATNLEILSKLETQKSQKILSDSFFEKLLMNVTKILSALVNQTETIRGIQHQVSQTHKTRVVVEEVSGNSGVIEFAGGTTSDIKRKIWVFRAEGNELRDPISFVMETNNLGKEAHLSLWGSNTGANRHVWNGSQTDWRKERKTTGDLILLTLTVKSSTIPGPPPAFKLRFTATTGTSSWEHSGEIIRGEGVQSLSFPNQNTQNYSEKAAFEAVLAPSSGRPFSLTLKYLDVPGTPPLCSDSYFNIYFLEESQTETNYRKLTASEFSRCGRLGNVSELIGVSTVAIVRFYSDYFSSNTGKGFRLEMVPN